MIPENPNNNLVIPNTSKHPSIVSAFHRQEPLKMYSHYTLKESVKQPFSNALGSTKNLQASTYKCLPTP